MPIHVVQQTAPSAQGISKVKGYTLVRFLTPISTNGKLIAIYESDNKPSSVAVVIESALGKVIESRIVASQLELDAITDSMRSAQRVSGTKAAYELGAKYVKGEV